MSSKWRSGDIALPWLVVLLAVMVAVGLGGASVGGWGGVAIVAAGLLAVVGILVLWSGAPGPGGDGTAAGDASEAEAATDAGAGSGTSSPIGSAEAEAATDTDAESDTRVRHSH